MLSVIEETGFTPNVFARGLGLNSISIIGIMCANSSDTFLAEAIYKLEQGLRTLNYDCLLCCTGYEKDNREKYLNLLISKRVDAVILVGSDFIDEKNNDYIIEASKKIPIILLNGELSSPNIYSVRCDDEQIVCDVTKHLILKNITNILYLNRRKSFSSTNKITGFKRAFNESNISLNSSQIKTFDGDIEKTCDFLEKLPQKFDAILASDDELAIACIKYAKRANLKVPNDIFIIGHNNSKFCHYSEPELSSIDNKLDYCCTSVISVVSSVLNKQNTPQKTVISAEFIKRDTSI